MWSLDLQVCWSPSCPHSAGMHQDVCVRLAAPSLPTSGPSGASAVRGRDIPQVGADSQEGEGTSQLLGVVSEARQQRGNLRGRKEG